MDVRLARKAEAQTEPDPRDGYCDLCGASGQACLTYIEVDYEAPEIEPRAVPARVFWIDAFCDRCGRYSALARGRQVIRVVNRVLQ